MKQCRLLAAASAAVVVLSLLTGCGKQEEAKVEKTAVDVKAAAEATVNAAAAVAREAEAFALATEAYIYGYPLVTMEMTRRVMTNVEKPQGTHAPMGQFVRMREYPERARIATSPRRTPTRSTPPPGSTSPRSRGSSACPT